jgi:hypothetical protein
VLHDDALVATSHKRMTHALTMRDQNGVFLEKGGRDSSCDVVSILMGQLLALHLPLPALEAALPAAVAWQISRILPCGEVDVTGNTRTGVGKEHSYRSGPISSISSISKPTTTGDPATHGTNNLNRNTLTLSINER